MRLKREVVAEREKFLADLFRQDPKMTVRVVQEKIKEKYGNQMRPHRILELRNQAAEQGVQTAKELTNEQAPQVEGAGFAATGTDVSGQ